MKQKVLLLLGFLCLGFWGGRLIACNLADFQLVSKTYNSLAQQWTITTQLHIGSGRTGSTLGADQGTRSIAIGFYKTCPAFTLYSFTPASITGPTTGCVMPGAINVNANPMNAQAYVMFTQPPACNTNGFACVTTTAACGNIAQTTYTLTFVTNVVPDSIRAFGVEGNGNLLGGCYPNIDMKIDFCALNGCPFNFPINCPGTQTLAVGPNCTATLPNYSSLAVFPPPTCPVTVDSVTQAPVVGSNAGAPGSAVSVSLYGHAGAFGATTCTFLVNVVDATPPTITCPANAALVLNGNCQVSLPSYVSQGAATDNCSAAPTVTQSPTAGTVLTGSGSTTVTLTATDAAGNSGTCSFTLTRQENTPPTITCPPNATIALNSNCEAQLPDFTGTTTATDNCQPAPTLVQAPSAGSLLSGTGTTTVTLTATDGAGNTAACALTVTRQDQSPPAVQCPASITLSPVGLDCNPTVTWAAVTATDNCGATLAGSHVSGDAFPVGATTVTYTATDGAGNTATCSFVVTVNAPQIIGTTTQSPSNACVGDVVTLTAMSASSYSWSTGATTQTLPVTTTGWYWVDVTGAPNCTARDSIFVIFSPLPQPALNQVGNQVCTGAFASYQWFLNGNPIPGATGACTPLAFSGNYSVQVTDSAGCTGSAGPLAFVGLPDKLPLHALVIYPNPAQNLLYLEVTQPITAAGRIVMYDIHGRAVLSQPFEQLDTRTQLSIEGLADGSYFVQVQADGFWGVKKVVKLR